MLLMHQELSVWNDPRTNHIFKGIYLLNQIENLYVLFFQWVSLLLFELLQSCSLILTLANHCPFDPITLRGLEVLFINKVCILGKYKTQGFWMRVHHWSTYWLILRLIWPKCRCYKFCWVFAIRFLVFDNDRYKWITIRSISLICWMLCKLLYYGTGNVVAGPTWFEMSMKWWYSFWLRHVLKIFVIHPSIFCEAWRIYLEGTAYTQITSKSWKHHILNCR